MNKKQPVKVSVICTVYNHENYLKQCFEGFVMQKTTFPIEVLVNDDCSKDGSAAIMREYEAKYPDIFRCVYQEENLYSKGINIWTDILLPMAQGEYIAVCEGDDYWIDPYKLQKQIDFLDAHREYVACIHNARVQYPAPHKTALFNDLDENHTPSTEDVILRKWFIATPSLVFRNVFISFPEWRNGIINVDYFMELMIAKEGNYYYMDDVMAVYRQNGMGLSAMLNSNKIDLMDKLIYILSSFKSLYPVKYSHVFDESIANYTKMKNEYTRELFYAQHPFCRAFHIKTYKRAVKRWLKKITNR